MFSRKKLRAGFFLFIFTSLALFIFIRHREIEEKGTLRWYDRALVFVGAPMIHGFTVLKNNVVTSSRHYLFLTQVERENRELRTWVDLLKGQLMFLHGLEQENGRLRRLLQMVPATHGEKVEQVVARVVAYPRIGVNRLITLDQGEEDGVHRRDPVVSADGLVGQIARVFGKYSQVLLITDPASAVDVRIEGTDARGLVVGKVLKLGLNRELFVGALEYLRQAVEIPEGARVVTSGLDGVYPPNIPVGNVLPKKKKQYDVFQQADVIPAVDFYKLHEVIILKR